MGMNVRMCATFAATALATGTLLADAQHAAVGQANVAAVTMPVIPKGKAADVKFFSVDGSTGIGGKCGSVPRLLADSRGSHAYAKFGFVKAGEADLRSRPIN